MAIKGRFQAPEGVQIDMATWRDAMDGPGDSSVIISLRDFLDWTGLPDLPAQSGRRDNEKTYPLKEWRGGKRRQVQVCLNDCGYIDLSQDAGPGFQYWAQDHLSGHLLFQGVGQEPRVWVSEISCLPNRPSDFDSNVQRRILNPNLREVQSLCFAFRLAITEGCPIGSPQNPRDAINSGANADLLLQAIAAARKPPTFQCAGGGFSSPEP